MTETVERVEREAAPVATARAAPRIRARARAFGRFMVRLPGTVGGGRWLALTLLAALLVLRAWDPAPIETLRLQIFDFYQTIKARQTPPQPVAVVDLDEESLAELGQWPWPRTVVADLVRQITAYGAVAIAFDVVFPEPDRMSPARVADVIRDANDAVRAELRRLPGNDDILAEAFRGSRVVVGQSGYHRTLSARDGPPKQASVATIGGDPRPYLFSYPGLVRNIAVLEDAALGHGLFTLTPERDGVVRRVPAVTAIDGVIMPTLSLELLRVATGQTTYAVKTDRAGVKSVVISGVEIPTDQQGRLWVHYSRDKPGSIVSAKDVLSGTAPPESLAGKLVLVGTSATGLVDIKATPLDEAMPGVEVHGHLLDTILSGSYLVRPNYATGSELLLTFVTGLLVILFVPVLGAVWTLLLGSVLAGAVAATSWYLYAAEGLLIDVAYTMVASFFLYGLLIYENYFREESRRRMVRSAFSQYLSPALVEQLAASPALLKLGGETKEMSFLFCDVRGFTTISEQYKKDPQGLTRLINRFLTPLTDVILEHQGTIDKYMGDCIMAFWNAPLGDNDHAQHACQSALRMFTALDELNEERRREAEDEGDPYLPLKIGIGVNTGECVVGNMGSEQRFDYSVLGDAVNLASRLEGQSKTYGVGVVIGSETARQVADRFAVLELDLIAVKGKKLPEHIFALLGDEERARDPAFRKFADENDRMLACYRRQDWQGAREAVQACRGLDPGLDLGAFYDLVEERIAAFEADPPGPDWDGVYVAQTK